MAWQWKLAIKLNVFVEWMWSEIYHTRDFNIGRLRSESSIWNHKHDFRPKLHDTQFNYHFNYYSYFEISKLSERQYLIDPIGG